MKKRNVIALSIFTFFYIAFGVVLTVNQEKVIYQPFPQDFDSCPDLPVAKQVTYQGTRMYISTTTGPVVVLYHGNAGSACDRAFYTPLFNDAGYGYVLVEYAGFSNDSREPSHELIKQDVRNIISYLQTTEVSEVAIVGESIGTGFASYHASLAPPKKLLLITPFTDLLDIAKGRFWFYPTTLMVDNALDNIKALKDYRGAVTIIHGTEDSIIPYKLGQRLYSNISTEKKLVTINGGDHNDLFTYRQTYSAIEEFLKAN